MIDGNSNHPTSLKRAIVSFIVSCCIRNIRGQINDHKSMLIHVSKDIKVNPIIKADAVEAVLLGVLFEFSVANLPRIPKTKL